MILRSIEILNGGCFKATYVSNFEGEEKTYWVSFPFENGKDLLDLTLSDRNELLKFQIDTQRKMLEKLTSQALKQK